MRIFSIYVLCVVLLECRLEPKNLHCSSTYKKKEFLQTDNKEVLFKVLMQHLIYWHNLISYQVYFVRTSKKDYETARVATKKVPTPQPRCTRAQTLMPGFCFIRLNSASMSITDCLMSLYMVPRKLRGKESWKSKPFTYTRSPTVRFPVTKRCWYKIYCYECVADVRCKVNLQELLDFGLHN